jgi:iron complex transport system substrate-binding protein
VAAALVVSLGVPWRTGTDGGGTVRAAAGTRQTGPPARSGAHRIVSHVPAVTEMLFAMGAGPDVAAVSTYDTYPPEAASRPKVGALVDPDFERILALRPDLVVVYGSQSELVRRLERARLPMFNYTHAGLPDITETIRDLGVRISRPEAGRHLAARIEADLARIRQRVAGRPRPRTALLFGREAGTLRGLYASAGVGFLHDMLLAAGGDDVFDDVKKQSLQVSTELLLARAPAVIVELHPSAGWDETRLHRERLLWNALPSLPAVRAGRIHLLADDRLLIPGPRVAEATEMIARALHPEAFTP